MTFQVAAFYRFAPLPFFREMRAPLAALCREDGIRGTILLAPEGINGTVAATPEAVGRLLETLRVPEGPARGALAGLEAKFSQAREMPFRRLKVRLKTEIVRLGAAGLDPARETGRFVPPAEWNALIAREDVLVVDVRNAFEVAMGSFAGAQDPGTARFGDFRDYATRVLAPHRERPIAMFCTGGIRCEKASAWLLSQGFADVRQLQGGILAYLEQVPAGESLWRGDCFVFDERIVLGHDDFAPEPGPGQAPEQGEGEG